METFIGVVAFAAIPKCGQHTLNKYKSGMILESKIRQFPLRIAFIRPPFDRFLSFFNFSTKTGYILDGELIHSYERFVDLALLSDDYHAAPQSLFIEGSMFNTLICIKSMSDIIGRLTGQKITIENESPRHDIDTSYRKDEVMQRYQDDTKMYNNCLNSRAL